MFKKIKKDYKIREKNLALFHYMWMSNVFAKINNINSNQKKNIKTYFAVFKNKKTTLLSAKQNPTNFCLDTQWDKSIQSFFNVSRHRVKFYVGKGKLPGIKQASW